MSEPYSITRTGWYRLIAPVPKPQTWDLCVGNGQHLGWDRCWAFVLSHVLGSKEIGIVWSIAYAMKSACEDAAEVKIRAAYEAGWRDACDDHMEQRRNPDHPIGARKRPAASVPANRERAGMNRLSEAERVLGLDVSASMPGRWYAEEVVEAIIESRLASVEEGLCDALMAARQGEYDGLTVEQHLESQIAALRAALGSDAHTEQKGAGAVSIRRSKSPCGNGGEHNPDCFDPGCPFDGGVDPVDPR